MSAKSEDGDGLTAYFAGRSMRHVDFLVAATSLSSSAFLFVICMLGLVRCRCSLPLPPQPWLESDTILQALCDVERPPKAVHCLLACISLSLGSRPRLNDNLPRRYLPTRCHSPFKPSLFGAWTGTGLYRSSWSYPRAPYGRTVLIQDHRGL